MAKKKLYDWNDGKGAVHSIPLSQHRQNAGLVPVTPNRPPPGSYDPALDQSERAAQRGYGQTLEDLLTQGSRATTDFGLGQQDIGRQYGQGLSDLLRERTQGQQDYQTNLQTLARNYQRLGNVQGQQARQRGVIEGGGFAAQSAQKRAANQAIERAPIDTSFNRFMEGSQIGEQRLGEQRDIATGQLGLNYQRGFEDIGTQQRRAGTELEAYLQDIAESRQAQYGKDLPTTWVRDPAAAAKAKMTRALKRTRIAGKPVTYEQWKRGDLLAALRGTRP